MPGPDGRPNIASASMAATLGGAERSQVVERGPLPLTLARLSTLADRLEILNNQLVHLGGSVPSHPTSDRPDQPRPDGLVHEILMTADRCNELVTYIEQRLQSLT